MALYMMKCLCMYGTNPVCDSKDHVIVINMKVKNSLFMV